MTAAPTPPTPKPAAPKPKTAKDPNAPKKERIGRMSKLFPESAKIELLVTENPKRKGSKSAERFEGYFKAKTVGDAVAAGVTYADIAYDVGHGFVKVHDAA